MDAKTRDAIDHLKSKGFEVYDGVPKWSELSIEDLANWRSKIFDRGQDMRRAQAAHSSAIDDELDRRMAEHC